MMRLPDWLIVMAAIVCALPFGWYLGVYAAWLLIGPEFGVFPVLTIPVGIVVAIAFVLRSRLAAWIRLAVMVGGTGVFALISTLVPA